MVFFVTDSVSEYPSLGIFQLIAKKEMDIAQAVKRVARWIVSGCRVAVGLIVMKAGIDLMGGATFTGYSRQDSLFVGGFVTIIGCYFVFSSVFQLFFKNDV